ncbi:outer membrane protein [Legionella sp. km772]|uniref:outer membrane protein n=1 Tax=Legionella sp. km772 TaxID=2498111 RepID=UPI000F8DE3E8|nr:hypothetical protein [Legionella sp. km772]RUR04480.1 hypothetical protein ELY15_15450 [Legionella sp. km772]
MVSKSIFYTLPLTCLLSGHVVAGTMGEVKTSMDGIFLGLGGSYNSVKLDRYLAATGISQVSSAGVNVASGLAGGPSSPFHQTQTTFAPEAQIGYLRHFNDLYSGGLKFSYRYLGITSSQSPVDNFQSGQFVTTSGESSFTGNYIVKSAQTNINHELSLLGFIGQHFGKFNVYLGAGPVVFETQSHLYGMNGFADIDGTHTDITGSGTNFKNTQWMWGGAGQLGLKYQLDPTWFIDINYTYAQTGSNKYTDRTLFTNTQVINGVSYVTTGVGSALSSQQITVQGIGLTVNKLFS